MKYVYGPVPSRRLGFSLGIDIVPYKTCTLDCIYCQIGRTTKKTVERRSYAKKLDVIEEVKEVLSKKKRIDYVTFSGSGEPTLNADIGELIDIVKCSTALPVAVLTNGTLLFMEDTRKNLLRADVVLPSLDAATLSVFRKVNRPYADLKIESILDGLKRFRKIYKGQIWLEIMLIKGFNDTMNELLNIKSAILEIKPDKVHLNTVVRPPTQMYAKPLSRKEMTSAQKILGANCEIIAEFHGQTVGETFHVQAAILEMAQRRPLRIVDVANVFGMSETNVEHMIKSLKLKKKIEEKHYHGEKYYSYTTVK